jgi:hypothetical protein
MQEMAKCYLYDIVDPVPAALTEAHWTQLAHRMSESGWHNAKGNRIGLVNVVRQNGLIGGYFANEGRKRGVQYTEDKEQVDPPPFFSFEHLFFVLFEDTAQLLLQSRNIYDYIDLELPIMRENLRHMLADMFRLVNVYVSRESIEIRSAGTTYTQEQLYSVFISIAQVTELEIYELHQARMPLPEDPRYKLFNPKDEWDPITWGAIADTLRLGLDRVSMSTVEAPDSTLQAPIPKALAGIGEIEKIRGRDTNGRIVYRQRKEDAELEVDLPVPPRMVPGILESILENLNSRGRVESWEERQRRRKEDQDRGTLLESLSEE